MVATSVAAGWAFAVYRFRGRDQLFLLLLATMFVPPIATLVPLYWLVQTAGLLDSLVGVLVPQLANAFGIFLIRQFARGVPTELLDAARVDGASEWQILRTHRRAAAAAGHRDARDVRVRLLLERLPLAAGHPPVARATTRSCWWSTSCSRTPPPSKYANVIYAGTLLAIIPNVVLFLRRAAGLLRTSGFSSAVKG